MAPVVPQAGLPGSAAAAVLRAALQQTMPELRIAAVRVDAVLLRRISTGQLIAPRDARGVLRSGIRPGDRAGRVRAVGRVPVAAAGPAWRPLLAPVARVLIGLVGGVVLGQAIGLAGGAVLGQAMGLVADVVLGRAIGRVGGVVLGQAIGLAGGAVLGQAIGLAGGAVLGQAMGLVGGAVLGQAMGLAGGAVLGQAIGLVADAVLGPVLARVARPVGHESRVRTVAITPVLVAARPVVGDQMIPVFEANPVTGANMLLQTALDLPAETGLLHIPLRYPEAGVGIRRPTQRQMMLLAARLKNVAKTESDFRRCFRGLVSRRVVRLRTGFEPGVSLSTAS
jgi:MFS family permease